MGKNNNKDGEDDDFFDDLKNNSPEDIEFDELVNTIKKGSNVRREVKVPQVDTESKIEKTEVQSFVHTKMAQAAELGLKALAAAQNEIEISSDPDTVNAFSGLLKSYADLLDKINKSPMQTEKIESAEKIAVLGAKAFITASDNAVKAKLIASRDDILAAIKGKKPLTQTEFVQIEPEKLEDKENDI